jgi:hypothetical protein
MEGKLERSLLILHVLHLDRMLHGYGYDGYFTSYGNLEFVFEDIEERWIFICVKQGTVE